MQLHMFFLLFAAGALLLNWRQVEPGGMPRIEGVLWASLLVLLVSVMLHEAGHVWFARRQGIPVTLVVLGPLGGMAPLPAGEDPAVDFRTQLAGPAANLLMAAACVPLLLLLDVPVWGLLNPLAPAELTEGSPGELLLKLVLWVNWCLVLVNLLPAFPLDGGYALQSALLARWPGMGERRATTIVARTAQVLAAVVLIAALAGGFDDGPMQSPRRFALVLLAIFLFFSACQRRPARAQQQPGSVEGLEFSGNLAALEEDLQHSAEEVPGPLLRWLQQRREARQRRQRELELEEDRRVDQILVRLHQQGMQSLTKEDRALLDRASARYRSRYGVDQR